VTRNTVAHGTYGYNALEQLVSRSTSAPGGPTGTIHYIYDLEGHIIAEADGATGATLREYIWLAANDNEPTELPLAIVDDIATTPVLLMVHTDHLARPIRLTDASRLTVWQASFTPWGQPQSISGTQALNLRFPGQYFQIETGLHYNWHRHYDPMTGRYTQPDPLRFVDGPSIYAYAKSSPLINVDPDGRVVQVIATCLANPACANALAAGLATTAYAIWAMCQPLDCHKASKYELRQAGIFDEHEYKKDHGAIPASRFDICKCNDGTIRIAPVGMCGRTREFWD